MLARDGRIARLTRTAALAGVLGLVAAVPVASGRSAHRVDAHGKITLSTAGVGIELRGKPFTHCRGTLEQAGTKTGILRARCTHGRIVVRTKETNSDGSRGTWRVTSGTKRYKHASGSGSYKGSYSTLKIRFRGTARY